MKSPLPRLRSLIFGGLAGAALLPGASMGQLELVKDIFEAGHPNLSNPVGFTQAGGIVYFSATTSGEGTELWKSDGTPAGTMMVKDITPGPLGSSPASLTALGNVILFAANDGINGLELWTSDGTPQGTVMLKDIMPGAGSSSLQSFILFQGALYFAANNGTTANGFELWKSDGTADGTVLFKDIRPGTPSGSPLNLAAAGSLFYFSANDGPTGQELWKSDGTPGGTVRVKDIRPGNGTSSSPAEICAVGPVVYFRAITDAEGNELWKSDGTEIGTVLVKDINPGTGFGGVSQLVNFNGTLFFRANNLVNGDELWKSDGTALGTVMVKDIGPGGQFTGGAPSELTVVGNTLFFKANDGVNGVELWKSDGTEGGTVLVKNIRAGDAASSSDPTFLTKAGSTLYFRADDGVNGAELWRTDGSEAGTVLVQDINPGAAAGSPSGLYGAGTTVYFSARNAAGNELWTSESTGSGAALLKDIGTGSGDAFPNRITAVGGSVYFAANDGVNGPELWKSDGTAAGTEMIKALRAGIANPNIEYMLNVNGTVYFSAEDGTTGGELWKTNGTAAGTLLVKDNFPGTDGSFPELLTNVNGSVFFRADNGVTGVELWKTNGTAAGTVLVKDIYPGDDASPQNLTNVNGTLFFVADNDDNGEELWKSNGTAGGTVLVKDINGDSFGSGLAHLTNVNGKLFFAADDDIAGTELWTSNGTAAGTKLVKDIRAGAASTSPDYFTAMNGILYFAANDGDNGNELWRSDGTAAGTVMVKDIVPGPGGSFPTAPQGDESDQPRRGFQVVNGIFYFTATDGVNGVELWRSDGTDAGTNMVKDIAPGPNGSAPGHLTDVNGTLYFDAQVNGSRHLWKTDGTEAGTVLVDDTVFDPKRLTVAGSSLFMDAKRGDVGTELFVLKGVGPPPVVITSHPVAQVVNPGKPASFTVKATGKPPLAFQWRKGGVDIIGAKAATYKINAAAEASEGAYDVVVTSTEGTATSNPASLAVNNPVVISPQPVNVLAPVGGQAQFMVQETGTAPLTRQWFKGAKAVAGGADGTLIFNSVTLLDASPYLVKITNPVGTVSSATAQLGVVNTAGFTVGVNAMASLVLNAPAAGAGLGFEWYKNGVLLANGALGGRVSGATTAKLTITKFAVADEDVFTCLVKLGGLELESGDIQVRVRTKPELAPVPPQDLPAWHVSALMNQPISTLVTLLNPQAQNIPSKFSITGLPPGLKYDPVTGQITGRATKAGTATLKISATNPAGTSATVAVVLQVLPLPPKTEGTFSGVIARNDTINNGHGGALTFVVASTGAISGKVVILGKSYSFTGVLDASLSAFNATASVLVKRGAGATALPSLTLGGTINQNTGAMTGTASQSGPSAAGAVEAWWNPWRTAAPANPASAQAGNYTAAFPIRSGQTPDPAGDETYPQGRGFTTLVVTTAGVATWKGQLADGSPFTQATTVGPGGQIPIHASLNAGLGSLQGWVTLFADGSNLPASFANNLLDGVVDWRRGAEPASSKVRSYKGGFPLHELSVEGGSWPKIVPPTPILGLTDTGTNNARLLFTNGRISDSTLAAGGSLQQFLRIKGPANTVVMPAGAANPGLVKLTLTTSTGLMTGSFTLKDTNTQPPGQVVTRTTNFYGAVVRRLAQGTGFFLLPRLPEAAAGNTPATTPTTSPMESGRVLFGDLP